MILGISRKKLFVGISLLALAYGIYLRVINLERPLIYDEVWGLMNWIARPVSEILTLFNNQNNHPLNSVFMKFSDFMFGRSLIMMRMHSLVAGILIPLFSGAIAWRLTKKRFIAAIAIILCSLHSGLIYYSHVARGYSVQSSAIMLFILLVLVYNDSSKKTGTAAICGVIGMIGCFVIACFSLSTAILYLAAIMVMHVIFILLSAWQHSNRKLFKMVSSAVVNNSVLVSGYAVITLFAAWMYLGHYAQFKSAVPAGGGFYINSFADILSFLSEMGKSLLPWLVWCSALLCFRFKKYRIIGLMTICYILPAFLAGVFIKVGPPRVYLPLVPVIIIAASTGVYSLTMVYKKWSRSLQIILPLLLVMFLMFSLPERYLKWSAIDWSDIISEINNEFPAHKSYRCYPANETLPISASLADEVKNNIKPIYDGMLFINFGRDQRIKGLNNKNGVGEVEFHSSEAPPLVNFSQINANIYVLKKVVAGSKIKSNLIFAEIPLQGVKTARAIINDLRSQGDEWYLLNCWFNSVRMSQSGKKLVSYQLISDSSKLSIAELLEIEQRSFGRVRFFWLSGEFESGPNVR
jgi:hypothetical protein